MDPDRDEVVVSRGRLGLEEGVGGWEQIEPTCGMFTQQQCCWQCWQELDCRKQQF